MNETYSLTKGSNFSLTKENPGLKTVKIGCSWSPKKGVGEFDVDSMAVCVDAKGKSINGMDGILFFGRRNPNSPDGAPFSIYNEGIHHSGDNRTGDGEGDDEVITLNFEKIPKEVDKVVILIHNYQGFEKRENFGYMDNVKATIYLPSGNVNINISEDFSSYYTIEVGHFYRYEGDWKFKNTGTGFTTDLRAVFNSYGAGI